MPKLQNAKDPKSSIEVIVAIVLGLLALACFFSQVLTTSEKTTGLESALFNMLQFLLTSGFAWFTTRVISRSEFERSIKRFAISAYRRIVDLDKITNRLKASVSEMIRSSPTHERGDFLVVEAIVEDTRHILKSSIDDWADVIGDELIALERMRRLEREKAELKASYEMSNKETNKKDEIETLDTQIDDLRSKIPTNLLVISQSDEDYQEIMSASWLADKHKEQDGFEFRVVAGGDYSSKPDPEKLNLDQELFTHKVKGGALDIVNESGTVLGRVLRPLPYDYDTSVKIIERCYGTSELAVGFVEIKKRYEMRGRHFMHYIVRVLSSPQPETDGKTVIVTK